MKIFTKKTFLIIAILFISTFSISQNVEWTKGYANSLGNCITSDVSGNIYTVGYFTAATSFGSFIFSSPSSDDDGYLIKSDPSGNILFAKSFGDGAECITIDATGNIYVTGYFSGTDTFGSFTLTSSNLFDIFICKIDPNGNVLWVKQYAAQNTTKIKSITHDTGGNIYVGGQFGGTLNFDSYTITANGSSDAFLAKVNASGNAQWLNQITAGTFESLNTLSIDASDNIYAIGSFAGTCNFGSTTLIATANSNAFLSKLNSNGTFIWTKQFGGMNTYGQFLSVNSSGKIHISGYYGYPLTLGANTFTSGNVYIAEIDVSGNVTWSNKFDNIFNPGPITSDPLGNVYTVGVFNNTATFSPEFILNPDTASGDAYISKLDASGAVVWVKQLTGHSYEYLYSIAHSLGKIYTTGYYGENCTIDNFTLAATSSLNTALIKIGSSTIGIKENSNTLNLKIYPNPVQDQVIIESNELDQTIKVKINDLLGTQIFTQLYNSSKVNVIDVSLLSRGIYFLNISSGDKTQAVKIVKE